MKYRLRIHCNSWDEKRSFSTKDYSKTKKAYFIDGPDYSGVSKVVDKAWILANRDKIVNVGVSGTKIYPLAVSDYEREHFANKVREEEMMRRGEMFDIPSILESIAADVKIGGMTWDQAAMELRKSGRNCFCVEDAKRMLNDYI